MPSVDVLGSNRPTLEFGLFDHRDRAGRPLGVQYEARLELLEAADRAGFYALHLAKHHATPVGMAPSPGIFLAPAAQRTRRLRLGPLAYTLALYQPLRVLEEICMLDQLSGGRFQLGIGRGISPYELGYYGVQPEDAQSLYAETLEIVLKGLALGIGQRLDHDGRRFQFRDVPIEIEPVQRPHPPLWYGVAKPESTVWTARRRVNIVCNGPTATIRTITDQYRREWTAAGHAARGLPKLGMSRFLVLAPTDVEAKALAQAAYHLWFASFIKLWRARGTRPPGALYAEDFSEMQRLGFGIAGSPARVHDILAEQVATAGINYLVCRFAFGDLAPAHALRSLELFVNEVMPALARAQPLGARPAITAAQ
jgi:alkanesulfonate monooxygenase SsuD/methylene tetrahydromethanopterin reductase-like flavin-dependent oxidoreductase (luciferase family)